MSGRVRLGATCAVLVLGCSLAACSKKERAATNGEPTSLPPQVSLYGVRLHSWEGNKLVSVGRAAKLTYDRSSANFEASEALVQFPSKDESQAREATADLVVRAPVASGNLTSRQADGSGGITVRSSSGMSGATESAHFDGVGLVATGEKPVKVFGPGYALDAANFKFYLATEELLFEGGVTSRLGQAEP